VESFLVNYLIVGSGPASWASALACIEEGIVPTVIDADNMLNSETSSIKTKYKEVIEKKILLPYTKGLQFRKRFFLSEIPYPTETKKLYDIPLKDSLYSRSSGGFSLVWGNAILPFRTRDMISRSWSTSDLISPSEYSKILNEIGGLTLNLDFLDFNLQNSNNQLNLISNSNIYINRWAGAKKIGTSSLTLDTSKCTNCGLCLDGCLYDSLFDSRSRFVELIKANKIKYIPNLTLLSFEKDANGVVANCQNLEGNLMRLCVDNLIIGAGALSSSIVVLKSLEIKSVEMSDSQAITFPLLRFRQLFPSTFRNIELSDIFIHSFDKFGSLTSHTQIYPANRITKDFFKKFLIGWRFGSILSVGHIFLDPSKSGKIKVNRLGVNEQSTIQFESFITLLQKAKGILAVLGLFFTAIKNGIFIIPILKFSRVGHSYHFGTAWCETSDSKNLVNDLLAKDFKSVITVDGSAIPHMPPGPPTLSIMAYSYKLTKRLITNNLKTS
jgi:hypothetical protein